MRLTTASNFLDVPFAGTRSGTFPLTWGQCWVWNSMVSRAPYFADLSGSYVVAVPDGRDMAAVSNALSALLDKYETFRSKYSVALDGTPHQLLLADGHLRVEVRDVDVDDAEPAAATVRDEFNNLPFTLPELPLRATVIASNSVPKFVILCVFHMAMDCHGMAPVLDDFSSFMSMCEQLAGASRSTTADVAQPVDRALEERGASGVQRSARGIQYWERELAKFPDDPLPYTGNRPESPRYKTFALHSAAMSVASHELAAELGVSTASVILALSASLLARRSGNQTCGIVVAASHRYDPESMRYPGTLVQGVPVVLDVSEGSPRRLILRSHRAAMLAALSGHCHPDDLADLIRRSYGAEGGRAKLACAANLSLPGTTEASLTGIGATRAEAERLLDESRYEYVEGTPMENERFYLAAQGDPTNFFITLRADTAAVKSADIVQFLRDLERSLIECLPHY